MNKKAVYKSLMEKIAYQVKKAIYEADSTQFNDFMPDDEIISLVDPSLVITGNDGQTYIDLNILSELPSEIINELIYEIIKTGEIEENNTDGYLSQIDYYLDVNDDSPILLRSADYYAITIYADVDYNFNVDSYYRGSTPSGGPDPDNMEISKDIQLLDVKLGDCSNNEVSIENEKVLEIIIDEIDGSEIEQNMMDKYIGNFDEYDYFYAEDFDDDTNDY